jgi:hypothetical protein
VLNSNAIFEQIGKLYAAPDWTFAVSCSRNDSRWKFYLSTSISSN